MGCGACQTLPYLANQTSEEIPIDKNINKNNNYNKDNTHINIKANNNDNTQNNINDISDINNNNNDNNDNTHNNIKDNSDINSNDNDNNTQNNKNDNSEINNNKETSNDENESVNDAEILDLSNKFKNQEEFYQFCQKKYPNLEYLNLSSNKIKDISCLKFLNAPKLKALDLSDNPIDNFEVFNELHFPLKKLNIKGIEINEIKVFIEASIMESLIIQFSEDKKENISLDDSNSENKTNCEPIYNINNKIISEQILNAIRTKKTITSKES